MTEQFTDLDWFRHFHQAGTTELTVIIGEALETPTDAAQKMLVDKYREKLDKILNSLKEEKPEPAAIFQKGLSALSDIDKERFILENLLEAVKRGDSINKTLKKYHHLGLIDIDVSQLPDDNTTEDNKANLPRPSVGAGGLLGRLLHKLKKVATNVMQLVINAMKVIPKFVGIKPSIGFAGPFPTFSLQLELQTESLNLYELFQDLTKGLGK